MGALWDGKSACPYLFRRLENQEKKGTSMDILTVSHLTKVYGEGEAATRALDDVSFTVADRKSVV